MSENQTRFVMAGLFCACVVMTNAVSAHLVQVGPFVAVAGALLYPVTFLLTDIMSEVHGKETARRAVWLGFACQLLAVCFVQVVALFPGMDPSVEAAWRRVFLPMARLAVASMIAYLIAQLIDVWVFHAVRDATRGRWLWLRNNVATVVAQAVDTAIFVSVAFAGVLPLGTLLKVAAGQYALKVIIAALDTPFCYAGVWGVRWLHRRYYDA